MRNEKIGARCGAEKNKSNSNGRQFANLPRMCRCCPRPGCRQLDFAFASIANFSILAARRDRGGPRPSRARLHPPCTVRPRCAHCALVVRQTQCTAHLLMSAAASFASRDRPGMAAALLFLSSCDLFGLCCALPSPPHGGWAVPRLQDLRHEHLAPARHQHRLPDIIPGVGSAVSPTAHQPDRPGWKPPVPGGDVFPTE